MNSLSITVKIRPSGGLIADATNQKALYNELIEKLGTSYSSKTLSLRYDKNNKCYYIYILLNKKKRANQLGESLIDCILNRYPLGDVAEILHIDESMIKKNVLWCQFVEFIKYIFSILKYAFLIIVISVLVVACFLFKHIENNSPSKKEISVKKTITIQKMN